MLTPLARLCRRRAVGAAATLVAGVVAWIGCATAVAARPGAPAIPAAAHVHAPALLARNALLIDASTGDVLYSRGSHKRVWIASTTKLMTALLTLERAPLDELLRVVAYPHSDVESTAGLGAGEHLTVRDLMRAMLLASANEAAQTLAVRIGGSERAFVAAMNARARALGLTGTHYATPVGLDVAGNYSTAADLLALAAADMRNPFFAATVAMPRARLSTGAYPREVVNRNDLVGRYRYVDGIKTGHTSLAGYVLVAAVHRGPVRLLSVVLGDPSLPTRDADTLALLRYGFARVDPVHAVTAGRVLATVPVRYAGGRVHLVAESSVTVAVPTGRHPKVSLRGVPARLTGPLAARTREGYAVVTDRGRALARVPLVTDRALAKPTLGQRLGDFAGRPLTLALLAALLACSLTLAVMQRRVMGRRRAQLAAREERSTSG